MIKKVLNIIGNIIFIVVLALLIFVIFTSLYAKMNGANPSFFGYSFSIVLTPSMSGEIEVGELIFFKVVDINTIKVGDNIVFKSIDPSSAVYGSNIVHKAIEIIPNSDGSVASIITKGVNNLIADNYPVTSSNFTGIVTGHSAFLGKVIVFLSSPTNVIFVTIILAIVYFVGKFVAKILKDEKKGA